MKTPENHSLHQTGDAVFEYGRWRVAFLAIVLRVAAGLGLLLIVSNFPLLENAERIEFSFVYLVLLVVTFTPLPYALKAGVLVAIGYFIGVYTLLQFGPWSGAVVYFLATTIFSGLFFDVRINRWVFGVNLATIVAIGALNILGYLDLASPEVPATDFLDWLSYTADFFVLAVAILWALNLSNMEFKSVAGQFQSALGFLSKDRLELEKRIEERTARLIKTTDQLRAASYISRQTAEIQDLNAILKTASNLIADQFGLYHAGILLMNESGDEVVLVSASSEGGKRMLERGYSLKVEPHGCVGFAASHKKPRIALDAGPDAVLFSNPDLPMTRSEVALPMLIHERVLGVLDIQSDQPGAFSAEDVDALQTLADQMAVVLENTRLLEEARAALTQIEELTATRTQEAWGQKIREGNHVYTYTPFGIRAGKESEGSDNTIKIPITLRRQKIGSISLARKDDATWNQIDKDLVNEVAYQTGLAIDNVRLVEDATQRARQEQLVGELATRFSQYTDIDSLLQAAARELGQISDVAEVSVYLGQIDEQASHRRRAKRAAG